MSISNLFVLYRMLKIKSVKWWYCDLHRRLMKTFPHVLKHSIITVAPRPSITDIWDVRLPSSGSALSFFWSSPLTSHLTGNNVKVKIKLCLCLIKHYSMKKTGEWSYSSTILDIGTRWRWVVSSTPGPLYPREKSPRYELDRRLFGPQILSRRCGIDKNLLPMPGIEPRPSSSRSITIAIGPHCKNTVAV
jgi:hypothetical protein